MGFYWADPQKMPQKAESQAQACHLSSWQGMGERQKGEDPEAHCGEPGAWT